MCSWLLAHHQRHGLDQRAVVLLRPQIGHAYDSGARHTGKDWRPAFRRGEERKVRNPPDTLNGNTQLVSRPIRKWLADCYHAADPSDQLPEQEGAALFNAVPAEMIVPDDHRVGPK